LRETRLTLLEGIETAAVGIIALKEVPRLARESDMRLGGVASTLGTERLRSGPFQSNAASRAEVFFSRLEEANSRAYHGNG
jgi:hypothetical protein